jgi:hypothetical protein
MEQTPRWHLNVDHLMACNCNYGCPCAFNAPPTYRSCEAALGYLVREGEYAGVDLSGLAWAMVATWPGPLHERNGRALIILDDRADPAQREAVEAIASGRAGGPMVVFMSTVTAGIEVCSGSIDAVVDGKESRLNVPALVDVAFGPIRNPVSGAEHRASALLPTGMLTNREDFYSADTFSVSAGDLSFAYPGRNGLTFRGDWRGP